VVQVNFCPEMLTVHDPDNIPANEDYLSTAVHEIVHALGFSKSKFAYFRSHEHGGEPRTVRSVYSPALIKYQQVIYYFGCGCAAAMPMVSLLMV